MTTSPTPRAEPKLRDSCETCAASKLKCSKERPTCARCMKRGKTCVYLVTRRAGRSHGKQTKKTQPIQQPTPEPVATVTSHAQPLQMTDAMQYSTNFQDMLAGSDQISDHQAFGTTPSDADLTLESYFATPTLLHTSELGDVSNTSGSMLDSDLGVPMFDASTLNFFAASQLLSPPHTSSSSSFPTHYGAINSESLHTEPHGGCLPRVLELLKRLCARAPVDCTAWPGQRPQSDFQSTALLQSAIAANKHTLDTVSKILACSCSQDGFLLTTTCLVVLKVMARYEATARSSPVSTSANSSAGSVDDGMTQFTSTSSMPGVMSCYDIEGEDSSRMGAQIVLSELYRVQRLIKELSKRLNAASLDLKNETMPLSSHTSSDMGASTGTSDKGTGDLADAALPFYAPFFRQLESDLCKWLRRLSEQTADLIRRA